MIFKSKLEIPWTSRDSSLKSSISQKKFQKDRWVTSKFPERPRIPRKTCPNAPSSNAQTNKCQKLKIPSSHQHAQNMRWPSFALKSDLKPVNHLFHKRFTNYNVSNVCAICIWISNRRFTSQKSTQAYDWHRKKLENNSVQLSILKENRGASHLVVGKAAYKPQRIVKQQFLVFKCVHFGSCRPLESAHDVHCSMVLTASRLI